ncbi:hypothetical protein Ancab_021890 [Ancistrocladus abbreviatus]
MYSEANEQDVDKNQSSNANIKLFTNPISNSADYFLKWTSTSHPAHLFSFKTTTTTTKTETESNSSRSSRMAKASRNTTSTPLFLLSILILFLQKAGAIHSGDQLDWMMISPSSSCVAGEESMNECSESGVIEMDMEMKRRVLATNKYISYGALQRNTVPCSLRGASYYNCQAGAQSNPYVRSCIIITRCRSS